MAKTAKSDEASNAVQELQAVTEKGAAVSEKAVMYTIEELINASEKALGVPKECAAAAFKFHEAEKFTLSEAKDIVKKFMSKEVK